jgi:hypothetical protein
MPERNDMSKPWDHARWAVEAADGATIEIETGSALTWAVRSLVAAGDDGFRPIAAKYKLWASMVARLRDLGMPVIDLPPDREGLSGFRLASPVRRST